MTESATSRSNRIRRIIYIKLKHFFSKLKYVINPVRYLLTIIMVFVFTSRLDMSDETLLCKKQQKKAETLCNKEQKLYHHNNKAFDKR